MGVQPSQQLRNHDGSPTYHSDQATGEASLEGSCLHDGALHLFLASSEVFYVLLEMSCNLERSYLRKCVMNQDAVNNQRGGD